MERRPKAAGSRIPPLQLLLLCHELPSAVVRLYLLDLHIPLSPHDSPICVIFRLGVDQGCGVDVFSYVARD
ncbi:hypothetical protein GY45DRAFT_1324528 [Cubamyces sp. BRFM 1775]|nr:hypothetical protein GY45DRAFT_1324528 [Cubamyces sp. BRFM 1775]